MRIAELTVSAWADGFDMKECMFMKGRVQYNVWKRNNNTSIYDT